MRSNLDELLKDVPAKSEYVAIYTNKVRVGIFDSMNEIEDNLLELRIFSLQREVRIFRDNVAAAFECRTLDDSFSPKFRDDYQYLDKAKSDDVDGGILYTMTGSGSFTLPYTDVKHKVKIRKYLKANESTGLYMVSDWRIVGFLREGEE